jgi:RNA polymerase sigma-70 factor (sigma-E family)
MISTQGLVSFDDACSFSWPSRRPGSVEEDVTDDEQFARFVQARSAALYRYAYLLTGDPHDADDLVQEALIRLRGAWRRVRRRDDPTGYARTTIARLHVSVWRRRRRETVMAQPPELPADDPGYAQALRRHAVRQALATLPPRQRAVIVLRFYENQSEQQIAEILGIAPGTVRSQAARALDKLRAMHRLELSLGGL